MKGNAVNETRTETTTVTQIYGDTGLTGQNAVDAISVLTAAGANYLSSTSGLSQSILASTNQAVQNIAEISKQSDSGNSLKNGMLLMTGGFLLFLTLKK